ncbi:vWA domain-containing protein [Dethiothermospora halolimnae]|uniref:vWA domain-containing protein n=1 Tax=Dethiothermospora halolimnae TaxID=3114390 RepID=UPI003CCB79BD
MERDIKFNQIILATDGRSNTGINPIEVAKKGRRKGITISTIGIIDSKGKSLKEVENIATAGGGICEITNIQNFSKTMEMVTQKSVYKTIEQAVNKELKEILGTDIEGTHPDNRKKIIDIIDKFGEEMHIRCCILIDCSGSMASKINIAKNSILNLLRVLQKRKGKTEISVVGYPGIDEQFYRVLCNFTNNIIDLEKGLQKVKCGGITPTGPAIEYGINMLLGEEKTKLEGNNLEQDLLGSNIV